jgi:hypothetical protein
MRWQNEGAESTGSIPGRRTGVASTPLLGLIATECRTAALYQTIADIFGRLPRACPKDILAEEEAEDVEEGGGDPDRAIVANHLHDADPPGVSVDEVSKAGMQDAAGGPPGAHPGDGRAALDHRTRRKTEA